MGTRRVGLIGRVWRGSVTIAVTSCAAVLIQPPSAYADPAPNCVPPPDDVMFAGEAGAPYASQTMCQNPDGSYSVCTPAAGTGPANCVNYPAAPDAAPANANPPAPVLPPPATP